MSTISLVAKEAHFLGYGTGKSHCYLVYENDAGQRFVTSLTDVSEEFFPFFTLRFNVEQINIPYEQAREVHDLNRAERVRFRWARRRCGLGPDQPARPRDQGREAHL
jgi:hypothetical protein